MKAKTLPPLPVPTHLTDYACHVQSGAGKVIFSVRCGCGGEQFTIRKNRFDDAQKQIIREYNDDCRKRKKNFLGIIVEEDERGRVHLYKRGLFGKKEEIFLPPQPGFMEVDIVKAGCASCGREIVLFDSRIHGFDALADTEEEAARKASYIPEFEQVGRGPARVDMEFENMLDQEQMSEILELEPDQYDYANSFDEVRIYAADERGKREEVFDSLNCHTAN